MTHSIDAPFPPPVPPTSGASNTTTDSSSTKDTAKGEAKSVHPLMYVVAGLFVIYFVQGALIGMLAG